MTLEQTVVVLIVLVSGAVIIWPASIICRRLGYSPFLGFLAIVPIANLGLLWFVALSAWPSAPAQGTAMPQ